MSRKVATVSSNVSGIDQRLQEACTTTRRMLKEAPSLLRKNMVEKDLALKDLSPRLNPLLLKPSRIGQLHEELETRNDVIKKYIYFADEFAYMKRVKNDVLPGSNHVQSMPHCNNNEEISGNNIVHCRKMKSYKEPFKEEHEAVICAALSVYRTSPRRRAKTACL